MANSRPAQTESIRGMMKYTRQQLLRIIKNITIQENAILTCCSKESIRGMMKYTHQQLLRIIENATIQENEILTYCSENPIRGIMNIYTSAAAANNKKHNDLREWETHILLKRTHPENYEYMYISSCYKESKSIKIQENGSLTNCSKESIRGMIKYTHQQLLRIIENITI